MKKVLSVLIIVLLCISAVGCGKETDALKFKKEYENINNKETEKGDHKYREVSIPKDNPFVYATADEIVKKIDDKESFVVYFGFKECPWCRSVLEEMINAAKDRNVKTIYYVDIKDIRDVKELAGDGETKTVKKGTKGYMALVDKLGKVLDEYTLTNKDGEEIEVGEKRIYAPNLVSVSNGEALQLEDGISDDLKDPYSKLTKKIKKYAYKKFECLFKCFEEEKGICQKNSC